MSIIRIDPDKLLPTAEQYAEAIQEHVDYNARAKDFSNGVTLASYVSSTNVEWAAQAIAFVAWRDAVWSYGYDEMAKVHSGHRLQPTVSQLISELPTIEW